MPHVLTARDGRNHTVSDERDLFQLVAEYMGSDFRDWLEEWGDDYKSELQDELDEARETAKETEKELDELKNHQRQIFTNMALVSMLAFWCGNVEEQIDRIFRTSGLMRDKWDRRTGDATYGQITIRNAVAASSAIYMPLNPGDMLDADEEFEDLDAEEDPEGQPDFEPDLSRITLTLEEMKPHTNPRYGREEIGIGNAFADYYKNIARYNGERGVWYVYDGKVWRPDIDSLAVSELAKTLADRLYVFALQISDEDTRNRYIKRVQKLQLRKNRKTMIEDAKSVYPVRQKRFDQNTHLFNCQNGTLNLTTGEFRDRTP